MPRLARSRPRRSQRVARYRRDRGTLGARERLRIEEPILERQLNAVRSEADRVVPAAQHQQVEDLGFSQFPGQPFPQSVIDARPVVQGISDVDQDTISRVGPAGVGRSRRGSMR